MLKAKFDARFGEASVEEKAGHILNEMLFTSREQPVTWVYFVAAVFAVLYEEEERAERRRRAVVASVLHRQYDVNCDGFLEKSEFLEMCREEKPTLAKLGVELKDDDDALGLFRKLDMNADLGLSPVELGFVICGEVD